MTPKSHLTRRAAMRAVVGLSLAPVLLASVAQAKGGPDPWEPKRRRTKEEFDTGCDRPCAPKDR